MRPKPPAAPCVRRRTCTAIALACTLAPLACMADAARVASATLTLTSDYVLRGVTQSDGAPAVQGSVDLCCAKGWSAGVWTSNVDFVDAGTPTDGADLEVDLYVARTFELGGIFSVDALLTRYVYPGTAPGVDYDYNEAVVTLHAGERLSGRLYWSNDAYASGRTGAGYELAAHHPLPGGVELEALYGYYDLERVFGGSYGYYGLGFSRPVAAFVLGMRYEGGDDAGGRMWGADAEGRLILRISAQF